MVFALSTYFGLYLAINDDSKALQGESPLRNWIILQFSFEFILPFCTLISFSIDKWQSCAKK